MLGIANRSWDALPEDLKPIVREVIQQNSKDVFEATKAFADESSWFLNEETECKYIVVDDSAELKKMIEIGAKITNDWIKQCQEWGYTFPPKMVEYMKGRGITVE